MNRPDPSIQGERVAYRVAVAALNLSQMACSGRRFGRADLTHCCVLSCGEVRATFDDLNYSGPPPKKSKPGLPEDTPMSRMDQ